MATIQEINHDSSTTLTDHYDGSITDTDGAITITPASRLDLSTNGLNMDYDAGSADAIVEQNITFSSDDFRYRFRIKLDGVTNNNSGTEICVVALYTGSSTVFQVKINANSGDSGFNVTAFYRDTTGKGGSNIQVGSGSDAISSTGEVCIQLRAIRESASPGSDGEVQLYIEGSSVQSISNAENRALFATIDKVRIDFDSTSVNVTGDLFYDQFLLDDDNTLATMCTAATDSFALIAGGGQT
jgi:hypothetical protein